jgi:hypothetical protein
MNEDNQDSYDNFLKEKLETIQLIINSKKTLEDLDLFDFEEADISAFGNDKVKFDKFNELKKDSLGFLRSVEDTLFKLQLQIKHERGLADGSIDENKVQKDKGSGLKKLTNLDENKFHV